MRCKRYCLLILLSHLALVFCEDRETTLSAAFQKELSNILPSEGPLESHILRLLQLLSQVKLAQCCPQMEVILFKNLGQLYFTNSQYNEATKYYTAIPQTDPSRWHPLALCAHFLGDLPSAASLYQRAIQMEQINAQLMFDYGVTLQHQGKVSLLKCL